VGTIDDSAVFLEDLETSTFPRPAPPPRTPSKPSTSTPTAANEPSSTSSKEDSAKKAKRAKWQDHDPYKLPDLDLETTIANLTTSANPDPRLASEAELLNFIEEMRPEDFDITSPAFRELPTEVQYEIIGDLRLKSRQTSFKRLRGMLKSSKTPLDFSRAQIKNLQQRNALTQRLLTTTDMVGTSSSHSPTKASSLAQTTQIKGRVASERNREYMLVKNEGADGGWVLAIKDEKGSTANKPIPVDDLGSESSSEDEGSDGEGRVPYVYSWTTALVNVETDQNCVLEVHSRDSKLHHL
jgi:DNA excision repair protein ERCC-5